MKTKRNLLVAGGLSAMVLSAALATAVDFQPLVVNPRGTLLMVQSVPCDQLVQVETDIADGRIEMTPARGLDIEGSADKIFNLTRLTMFIKRFNVRGDCMGIRDSHRVSDIGIQLASAVSFRAVAADRVNYLIRIPKDQFLLYESFVDNGVPKTVYKKPSEDVTGFIDLASRALRLRIVTESRLRFDVGGRNNRVLFGTQTADIAGTIVFPDTPTTAPR